MTYDMLFTPCNHDNDIKQTGPETSILESQAQGPHRMDRFHLVILIAALAYPMQGAEVGRPYCVQRYQEAIKEAASIKEDCEGAAFYDCCQVQTVKSSASAACYEIADVCNNEPFETPSKSIARCDMETDKGGWIVIQRRANESSINFYRGWDDYEQGFGDLETEFWWGLRKIHCLTRRDDVELRIDLKDESGNEVTWVYQEFRVDGPEDKYRLHIGQGEGTEGTTDSMAQHNNQYFSTFDRDNDIWNHNCAELHRGAWWYKGCFTANLNGPHDPIIPPPPNPAANRIIWYNSGWVYYPYVEMKVRPKTCTPCTDDK